MFNERSIFPSLSASENQIPMTIDSAVQVLLGWTLSWDTLQGYRLHLLLLTWSMCRHSRRKNTGLVYAEQHLPHSFLSLFYFKKTDKISCCCFYPLSQEDDSNILLTTEPLLHLRVFLKSNGEDINLKCRVQLNFQWHHSTVPPLT